MALNLAKTTKGNGNKAKLLSTTAEQAPAAFSIQLHMDWTPEGAKEGSGYKAGEYVSKPDHIAEIIRTIINNADDETAAERIKETKNEQIVAVAKTAETKDMNAEDALAAIIAKVTEAKFMVRPDEDVPTADHLAAVRANRGSSQAMAQTLGAKVGVEITGLIARSLLALRTADACAPMVAIKLGKQFDASERAFVPPIMSRYRPHQARGKSVAPWGYRAPDQSEDAVALPLYNGPWDLSETHNTSGVGKEWPTTDWCDDFTACTPDGRPWFVRVECLRKIVANKDIPTEVDGNKVSDELLIELQALKGSGDENKQKDALKEASWEFNKRKTWYSKGWQVLQAIEYIESRFKHITVNLYDLHEKGIALDDATDEQLEQATRKRNPYRLVTTKEVTNSQGKKVLRETPHLAIPMGKLMTIAKLAHRVSENTEGGTLQTLKNQRPKPGSDTAKTDTAHAVGVDGMPPVNTVDGLGKHMRTVVNYLDNEDNFTTLQRKAREDGDLASTLVRVRAALNNLIGDKGGKSSAIEKLAQKYEDDATKAQAADAA